MYRQNPVRRDMFAYVPFQNMGQTYTSLAYDYRSVGISPDFGMRGNRFYFSQAQQIPYFYLPTPMIEFSFKSGISQGQMLQSFFLSQSYPLSLISLSATMLCVRWGIIRIFFLLWGAFQRDSLIIQRIKNTWLWHIMPMRK